MNVIIRSNIVQNWLQDKDPFDTVKSIKGRVVRFKDGRTTQRFEIDGAGFYAKYHEGVGWAEIIKNLAQFRLPVLGASNEWFAINHLHSLGLDTLSAVAYGVKGENPASQESFLITEELEDVVSLEDLAAEWGQQAPSFASKKALINKVAEITRIMHQGGVNHRDLYICHFLLKTSLATGSIDPDSLRLHLIDLHRAQIRPSVPRRWLVKDVGSLYFSILRAGFTRRDIYRFLQVYYQQPLRQTLLEHSDFLSAATRRAVSLYKRDFKEDPSLPC